MSFKINTFQCIRAFTVLLYCIPNESCLRFAVGFAVWVRALADAFGWVPYDEDLSCLIANRSSWTFTILLGRVPQTLRLSFCRDCAVVGTLAQVLLVTPNDANLVSIVVDRARGAFAIAEINFDLGQRLGECVSHFSDGTRALS